MLENISGKILSNLPNETPYLFYGAAAVVGGRKWVQAAGCKAWAVVAEKLGKANAAEWNQSSQHYWTMAKKDTAYDLTLAAAIAMTGFTLGQNKTNFELLNNITQVNNSTEHTDSFKEMESNLTASIDNYKKIENDLQTRVNVLEIELSSTTKLLNIEKNVSNAYSLVADKRLFIAEESFKAFWGMTYTMTAATLFSGYVGYWIANSRK